MSHTTKSIFTSTKTQLRTRLIAVTRCSAWYYVFERELSTCKLFYEYLTERNYAFPVRWKIPPSPRKIYACDKVCGPVCYSRRPLETMNACIPRYATLKTAKCRVYMKIVEEMSKFPYLLYRLIIVLPQSHPTINKESSVVNVLAEIVVGRVIPNSNWFGGWQRLWFQ